MLASVCLLLAGQGRAHASPAPQQLGAGHYALSLKEGAAERTYLLTVPPAYQPGKRLPLVVLLHGWTSDAKAVEVYTDFRPVAESKGFILCCPDGTGQVRGWNCGFLDLGKAGVDDVKFLSDLVTEVEKQVRVDPRRVYFAGHSNGAMMAYVMGSALSAKVAAIGVASGTTGFDRGAHQASVAPPAKPVSAIIFHGLLDPTVPYDHGAGLPEGMRPLLPNCVGAVAAATFWAHADGLSFEPAHPASTNPEVRLSDWKRGGVEVELYSIVDGTHAFPGGFGLEGRESKTGVSAAALMWRFFASHPKR